MSLINQMLKDLDARRSDVAGGSAFGQQIRAVPRAHRVHPAWWLAVAAGGVLFGAAAFALLRPVPETARAGGQFSLKLDTGISVPAMPVTTGAAAPDAQGSESSGQQPAAEVSAAAVVTPALPITVKAAPERVAEPPKKPVPVKETSTAPAADAVRSTKAMVAPAPAAVKDTEVARPPAASAAPFARPGDSNPPPVAGKQVKQLSSAQLAENEYRKAMQLLQQGKRAEAVAGFEHALRIDAGHAGARTAVVGILLDGKQHSEAVAQAREGLDINPAQTGLAMVLARLQLEKGEVRPAIATLERSLPHALGRADYLAFLAALLQRDEQHKPAVEHYLMALQKAPQNGVWWMGLGISLQAENRLADAREAFRRAKATNALSAELLAFVEARIGQLQQ